MKLKRYNKILSILVTLSMLLVLLVPLATPAAASSEYSTITANSVEDDGVRNLGKVLVHLPAGSLSAGSTVTFRLPGDFIFTNAVLGANESVAKAAYQGVNGAADWAYIAGPPRTYGNGSNYIEIPEFVSSDPNGLWGTNLTLARISNKEVRLTVPAAPASSGNDCWFYVVVGGAYVPGGYTGEIPLEFSTSSGTGFTNGSVPIGSVSGGEATISVSSVESFTDHDQVAFRITEDRAGALADENESLKIKLPNGFIWGSLDEINPIWGDAALVARLTNADAFKEIEGVGDDELVINLPAGFTTSSATSIEIKATIQVDDETDAKTGDVMAKISGETTVTPSEAKVGTYGTYETKIECADAPEVYAGMLEQKIGKIVITESVEESITNGRTLTLELPSNAKWGALDNDDDSGLSLDVTNFPGTDGKMVKFTFDSGANPGSTDAATLELKDMEVVLEPGTIGDLKVKVGGTAGLTGELTVAKIVAPIKVAAASAPEIKIGSVGEVGDITITEAAAGVIRDGEDMILDLPQGVRFASAPKVEVTEGDLRIDQDSVKTQKDGEEDDNQVKMTVDSDSTTASVIKVSGIKYVCDRTVPEGDVTIKVKGDAVAQVNDPAEVNDYYTFVTDTVQLESKPAFSLAAGDHKVFPNTATAGKAINAKVVTPASTEYAANATFVIGDTKFKVNGIEQTMDVAPYISNDRTYLPVRYVAQALGVAASNIMWNEADQSVIIIKGDRIIKLVIGSTTMLINGVPFTMDVAPEIVDPGRTMLPLRWVAQALGADVQWDAATQTVTVITK